MKKPNWAIAYKLIWGVYPMAGGKGQPAQPAQVISLPAQPPAPSASESAESIYQARAKYDPLLARQQYDIQQEYIPKQAALEAALYRQYYPEYARSQQTLQRELYPQQSQILEAGAGNILQRLRSPYGYTPEEEQALAGLRQRQREQLTKGLRERENLGGGLYSGRAARREEQALTELEQAFAAEDINRKLQGNYQAMQLANPYMQILYPQIGTTQPQFQPFQYQTATPSPDVLYNAMNQASRRDYAVQPAMAGSPSPMWQLGGQLGAQAMQGAATIGAAAILASSIRYKKNIKLWAKPLNYLNN